VPDSLGFLDAVGGLPEQLADAHRSARDALDGISLPSAQDIDNVAVLGMGGSGIAGDVLAAVANATLPVPVVVLKQIRTPRFIGPRTLAFAVSYSGDTDETLRMAAGALDAGARVVAVSRGGELESMARAPAASLPALTIAFELRTASLLGYRPRLDACANCGNPLSPERLFSPARGGLVCDGCAAEGGTVRLSADALAGLSLLLSRPVGEAGEYLEVKRSGEILRVVEAFLKHQFQRFQGLKSLELLRSLAPETPELVA